VFAFVIWKLLGRSSTGIVLAVAAIMWLGVSISLWYTRRIVRTLTKLTGSLD